MFYRQRFLHPELIGAHFCVFEHLPRLGNYQRAGKRVRALREPPKRFGNYQRAGKRVRALREPPKRSWQHRLCDPSLSHSLVFLPLVLLGHLPRNFFCTLRTLQC
ncbi:hypothetical protein RSAG8_07937, partial [Rhizoctonia solani AG-8 WAC10335]